MAAVPWRDTKTRYQGVFARHQQKCTGTATGDPRACDRTPSFYGVIWDRGARKHRKTRRFQRAGEARNARQDLSDALQAGKLPASSGAGALVGAEMGFYPTATR